MNDLRRCLALMALTLPAGFVGLPAYAQNVPAAGILQLPPVTPQQADQFFATRVVPPSNAPAIAPSASLAAQPLQSLNVAPVLGHELPTDPVTALGLPRADFATAKPGAERTPSAIGDAAVVGPRTPGTAVIPQQPPTIGKP